MEIFIPAKFIYDCSTYRVKDPGRKSVQCALCRNKECLIGKNCSVIKSGLDYSGDNLKSIQISAWLESDPTKRTKLEEIAIYSKRLGYRKIGIAFCIEHEREARLVYDILSRYFDVFSVCCKVCSIEKESLDIRKTVESEFEAACNPIGQALLLNDDRTDLNIMLGLKTGYDILFAKYSEAPSITLPLLELPSTGDSEIDFIE
ncbi:conserved protein [Methanosarcina mazei Go1]|jgi:uncharacterized metal-binding protein|uniref:Conserved protein n=1 Tax=Methanosarcina mazei (strain ATCC BAA-159 / DSM 3647 / Goe1 / Go1 / JCM 11833 / OCM 88) TaxID=192952 RepID=Q8PY81_METMA|nr:conserved protein [Methanosarcina mazei Go1]